MQKVKRKQIDFGGTEEQYIKGNGELGLIEEIASNNTPVVDNGDNNNNDIFVVELLSHNAVYSAMRNEGLWYDINPEDLFQAIVDNKTIMYVIRFSNAGNTRTILTQVTASFSNQTNNQDNSIVYTYLAKLAIYNKFHNDYASVDITLSATRNEENQELNTTYLTCKGNYLGVLIQEQTPITIRTINDEQITDSSLGNINIHDGYYFPNAVQDYDGNWYGAVVIGNQVWLGENLRCTKALIDNNLTTINEFDESITTPQVICYAKNDDSIFTLKERGYSYTYEAAKLMTPENWHLPSDLEYIHLFNYLALQRRYQLADDDMYASVIANSAYTPNNRWNSNGYQAKAIASQFGWTNVDDRYSIGFKQGLNNRSGFNAFPTGTRFNSGWIEEQMKAYFWATMDSDPNNATYVMLLYTESRTMLLSAISLYNLYSVRYLSNLNPIQFRNWYIQQYNSLQHHLSSDINITGLPAVTSADNGKILQVVNGVWTLVNPNN